jgi:cytochrome d ubiquinol oxidase subunit II
LLSPFALLSGVVSVTMIVMQGAAWLSHKTEGAVADRARWIGPIAALLLVLLFIIAGIWIATTVDGFMIVDGGDPNGPSNPAYKTVVADRGAWLYNYALYKWPAVAPALTCVGALAAAVLMATRRSGLALLSSSIAVAGVVTTAGFSMYPFLLPSSTHPNDSLTIWDASSSQMTLGLMLGAVIFFLPIILAYTSWVYYVLRGRVTETAIEQGDDYYY